MPYSLTFDASYYEAGGTVEFDGYLYSDATGISGYLIDIYRTDLYGSEMEKVTSSVSEVVPVLGHYDGYWVIPQQFYGMAVYFKARCDALGIQSSVKRVDIPGPVTIPGLVASLGSLIAGFLMVIGGYLS